MYIIESTPPVLSVSARCADGHIDFIRLREKIPAIVSEDGRVIPLDLHDKSPYLDIDGKHTYMSKAEIAKDTGVYMRKGKVRLRYIPGDTTPGNSDSETDAAPAPIKPKPLTSTIETQTAIGYTEQLDSDEEEEIEERGRPSERPDLITETRSSGDRPKAARSGKKVFTKKRTDTTSKTNRYLNSQTT